MTKLTKAQTKRFDKFIHDRICGDIDWQEWRDEFGVQLKQHLSDELSRQRQHYPKDLLRWHDNEMQRQKEKHLKALEIFKAKNLKEIDELERKVEKRMGELLSRQKKEIIEELEKIDTIDVNESSLDWFSKQEVIKTIKKVKEI